MDSFVPRRVGDARPEAKLQNRIINMLLLKRWYVKVCPSTALASGWPDLYATNSKYGSRWIEVKKPGMVDSKFTPAQLDEFPKLTANGSGVWILTWPDEEQYERLFHKANWWKYLDRNIARQMDIKYIKLFDKEYNK